jgi:hypothetical protein
MKYTLGEIRVPILLVRKLKRGNVLSQFQQTVSSSSHPIFLGSAHNLYLWFPDAKLELGKEILRD